MQSCGATQSYGAIPMRGKVDERPRFVNGAPRLSPRRAYLLVGTDLSEEFDPSPSGVKLFIVNKHTVT